MAATNREKALQSKGRGNGFFRQQKWSEAIAEFTEAIRLDPTDHVFFSNRSACYAGQKEFENALEDAEKCIEIKPDWPKGYSRKGLAEYSLGRYEDAIETYEKGLGVDSSNAALADGLKQAKESLRHSQSPRGAPGGGPGGPGGSGDPMAAMFGPEMWTKLATNPVTSQLMNDPEVVKKINNLQSNPQFYLQQYLQDPQMQPVFSTIFGIPMQKQPGYSPPDGDGDKQSGDGATPMDTSKDDKPSASSAAKKAKTESPPEPETQTEEEKNKSEAEAEKAKGTDCYKKRKFKSAIDHYTKAYELDPVNPVYLTNRSAVYFMIEDWDSCMKDCEEAIKVGRENYAPLKYNAKAYARMGDVSMKRDELDNAIEHYTQSLVEEKNYKIRKKLEKVKEAQKRRAADAYLDSEKALHHKELGNEFFKNLKFKEAIDEYTESLRRNPNDHKVYSNRAGAYAKLMSWNEAIRDCDKSIKLQSDFAKAYLRKGKIQHAIKEFQKALKTYDEGIENCTEGLAQLEDAKRETLSGVQRQNMSGEIDPQQRERALADPEVQKILKDPTIQKVLQEIQSDPAASQAALADPVIRRKLETLMAAGILSTRA